MNGRYVLGIDLGTSSCKVRVVSFEGRTAGSAVAEYETLSPRPGYAEQRPADWLRAVRLAVADAMKVAGVAAKHIEAIGLTGAAHIGVLLGLDGPLRPAILWQDQRSSHEAAELQQSFGEEILGISANRVSPAWTLAHLAWIRRHEPKVWQRLTRVVFSKDYLLEWLTGEAVTDPGTAVAGQLYDVNSGRWSARLCKIAGLRVSMLPKVSPARAVVGGLTREASRALGLTEGTPVINGCLDSAAELIAVGAVKPGSALVRLASAGGVQLVGRRPNKDGDHISYPHMARPYWYQQAGTSTCATAVKWARDLFGAGMSWAEWDQAARTVPPGSEGLMFHPYLAGERTPLWNSAVRGSFTGIGLHHGPGHFARAAYEGTAYSIRHAMQALEDGLSQGSPLPVVGGGARSSVWLEILSAVLSRSLLAAVEADSSLGAGLMAWEGLREKTGFRVNAVKIEGCADYSAEYDRYKRVSDALVSLN